MSNLELLPTELAPGVFDVRGMDELPPTQAVLCYFDGSNDGARGHLDSVKYSGHAVHASAEKIAPAERPLAHDIAGLAVAKESFRSGKEPLGAAYAMLRLDLQLWQEYPESRESIDFQTTRKYLSSISGLSSAMDGVTLGGEDTAKQIETITKKVEVRIRMARRLTTYRLGEYLHGRRGSAWALAGQYQNDSDVPSSGYAAPLLGLGAVGGIGTHNRSEEQTVAVLGGKDGKPYWHSLAIVVATMLTKPQYYAPYQHSDRYNETMRLQLQREFKED